MSFSTLRTAVAAVILAACGTGAGDRGAPASARTAGTDTAFRVALLTPGSITDQAWNGGAYAGLQRLRDSLGATISHVQTRTPAEFDENFRLYGEQGYRLVIGHGFEYQDAATRVATDFPRTIYLTTSGNRQGPNLAGLEFAFEDGSYLAGIVAGAMTKSGIIGAIGGQEIPPVKRSFDAFARGARSVNPRVQVVTSYIGNWDDAAAGKEQALAQIRRNVDVIYQNADAAGLGVFQAVKENPAVRIFGANADQNGVAPEVTLASVVIDLPHAFLLVGREVAAGTFKPRVVSLGIADDVVRLTLNPRLAASIPAATRAAVDSVRARMAAGSFRLPSDSAAPAAAAPAP
jgi:basic membrane lipoprotein Med (substrate-binding protein (PBP1-ABC) superfamily)